MALVKGIIYNVFHKNQLGIKQAIQRFLDFVQSCPERVLRRIGCNR